MVVHDPSYRADVVVAGGGIAGLAAAIALARNGLRVRCIEPTRFPRVRVGESLDWSAPQLLDSLGIGCDRVVAAGVGTSKRAVHGYTNEGRHLMAGPPDWFQWWPLRFEPETLHVDRERFDQRLFDTATRAGVEFSWDRIGAVQMEGDRVVACTTAAGTTQRADWFIDASGRSRLVGRAAGIDVRTWRTQQMALWTHRPAPLSVDGTVLHVDDAADNLAWAWEIPIDIARTSVGVVMPFDEFKALRRRLGSVDEVFAAVMRRFPMLEPVPPASPNARSYRPYVSDRVAGENWLMVGESAAMIDPLTSLGVTAALRHGTEAAEIIIQSHEDPANSQRLLARYDRRVRGIGTLYNDAISQLLYEAELRRRIGFRQAARAYVIVGYLTNALYSRLRPASSRVRSAAMGTVMAFFRAWIRSWLAASRVTRPTPGSEPGNLAHGTERHNGT